MSGALTDDARLGEVFSRAMIGCAIFVQRIHVSASSKFPLFYILKPENLGKYRHPGGTRI